MGGNNSKEEYHNDVDEEKHVTCAFLHPIFCMKTKSKHKPFGTPQTTPKPTRPPIYGGLEAEPSSRSIGDLFELYKQSAVIHDGEVRAPKQFINTVLMMLHNFSPFFQKVIFFFKQLFPYTFPLLLGPFHFWIK